MDDTGEVSYTKTFRCDEDEGAHVNTATIRETCQSDAASKSWYQVLLTPPAGSPYYQLSSHRGEAEPARRGGLDRCGERGDRGRGAVLRRLRAVRNKLSKGKRAEILSPRRSLSTTRATSGPGHCDDHGAGRDAERAEAPEGAPLSFLSRLGGDRPRVARDAPGRSEPGRLGPAPYE